MPMPVPVRLAAIASALLLAGCESAPTWPAPKNTTDIVLADSRRDVATTVGLGDALHLILPAPVKAGMQWQMLAQDTKKLRTMSELQPAASGGGASEVSFQAIRTVSHTTLQFAAVDPKAATSNPDEIFTVNVSIDNR